MGKSYRPYYPEQEFLLLPSLREWLPENHLVYFVSDVVDNLYLSALDAVYGDEQRGQPPVRAGFTPASREALFKGFSKLELAECPFPNLPEASKGRWGTGITCHEH